MRFRPELSVVPMPNSIQRRRLQVQFHFVPPPFLRGMMGAQLNLALPKIGRGNALQTQLQLVCGS